MAVIVDNTNKQVLGYQGGSPYTLTGGVIAIADTRLLVCLGAADTNGPPATVTYGGVSMTLVGHNSYTSSGTSDVSWWYLDNPAVGTANVIATTTGGVIYSALGAAFLPVQGADLTRAPSIGTGAGATSTSPACTAPAAATNDLQLAGMLTRAAAITAPGGNQVNLGTALAINTIYAFSADDILGVNPGTFSWTVTSNDWSTIAVTIFGVSLGGTLFAQSGAYDLTGAPSSSDFAGFTLSGAYAIAGQIATLTSAAGPVAPTLTGTYSLSTTNQISVTAYDTRTVIDRAYGALGLTPQQITGEKITIAQDLLSLALTDMVNTANPVWCLDKTLVTLVQGQRSYTLPIGTNDVDRAFYRTMNNVTPAVFSATGTAYTIDFGLNALGANNDTFVSSWAIAWGLPAVAVIFQSSEDQVTWTQVGKSGLTNSSGSGVIWYDMENTNAARYWRAIPVTGTFAIGSFVVAKVYNTPNDINMYRMNKDDYWSMVNKVVQGRPLQFYLRRGLSPSMDVWQQPDLTASQNLMVVYRQRLIMDVGTLQQQIEVPTRWFYTIIFVLADALAFCTPEAKPDRIQMVQQRAQQMLKTTWTEERDKSPVKFNVNLRAYTR